MISMQWKLKRLVRATLIALVLAGMTSTGALAQEAEVPGSDADAQKIDADKPAEDADEQRFMVVLTIGENEARALRRDGNLRATLPAKFHNRVDSILLKHPTTFLKKKLVIQDDIDKLGRTLLVNIDESVVDRLEYQPVQMKVYQSGYNTIVLKYLRPKSRAKLASLRRGASPKPNDSPQVFVRLSPKNGTTGWVRDMKSLTVNTNFGAVEMPLNRIVGIRFNADQSQDVAIVSATGDYVSGQIDQSEIVLATRWGDERIPISKLESITSNRNARFTESQLDEGPRWILTQPSQPALSRPTNQRIQANPPFIGLPNPRF